MKVDDLTAGKNEIREKICIIKIYMIYDHRKKVKELATAKQKNLYWANILTSEEISNVN